MSDEREQRNAVFGAGPPAGINPNIQAFSAADKVKADFGLDIPNEVVPLPSAGKVYPQTSSLHERDTIEIRSMTAREEDILSSKAFLKKGTVISELIKSCITDKSVNPVDLLSGDRNALMVAIRITGYGAEYGAEIVCSDCQEKTLQNFDLGALPIKRLELEPVIAGQNLFEFVLPRCKKVVRFKFLTGRDEDEMTATAEKQKKLGLGGESSVTTGLLYSIVSIAGIEDRAKIAGFVKVMPAGDSLALRNYIRDNEPGITMRQTMQCPACSHEEEVNMPLGVSFLWPAARK